MEALNYSVALYLLGRASGSDHRRIERSPCLAIDISVVDDGRKRYLRETYAAAISLTQ